jgi:ABC-type nitrate/sulfonate/bicarbonate transport system permease component
VGGQPGLCPAGVLAACRRTLAWKPQASWRAFQLPLILLALWQLASQWGWIDGALFSSPLAVATRFIQAP